jgi:RNA polymerase sigma-70 factor (ECF subfamily)
MLVMAETIDDELLVGQFNRGDESAFDRIVERYATDVAALANRLLGWPGDVEDVTQEVFLSAFLGLKKFRCDCRLKTWLFTITINKCRSYRYKRKLQRLQTIGIEMRPPQTETDASLMDEEQFMRVRNAVARLPAKYREPLVLRYLQELPTMEIVRILGVSRNVLNVRLSRARDYLRQELTQSFR